jgi:ABC-type lipoprotein export system ATPase subunit
MVTHNPDYAKQASRSIHLFDGRLVGENRIAHRPLAVAVDASA